MIGRRSPSGTFPNSRPARPCKSCKAGICTSSCAQPVKWVSRAIRSCQATSSSSSRLWRAMPEAAIARVQTAAAHDGEAELLVTLHFDNGGETEIALDAFAADHLMRACGASSAAELIGQGWRFVRD